MREVVSGVVGSEYAEARKMLESGVPADYIYYTLKFDKELGLLIEAGSELGLDRELAEILVSVAGYLKERDEAGSYLRNTIASEPISEEEAILRFEFVRKRLKESEYDESRILERASYLSLAGKPEEGLKDIGIELIDKYLDLGIPAPVLAIRIVGVLGDVFKSRTKDSISIEI